MTASTTTSATTGGATGPPRSTGRQPSEQAIDAAIDSATRLLRLPTIRDRYDEIADSAGRERLSYRAFLSELLLAECDDREERRAGTVRLVHRVLTKALSDAVESRRLAANPAQYAKVPERQASRPGPWVPCSSAWAPLWCTRH